MTICFVGLGLIGGSMAIDLRRRGFANSFTGVEKDGGNAAEAVSLGLVDKVLPLREAVGEADVIVVSTPVCAALNLLPEILDIVEGSGKVVLDVCSVKKVLADKVAGHGARGRYVATHPMAGTEYSGPSAAVTGLFDGKAGIICDAASSDVDALEVAERLYGCLGMRIVRMNSADHDEHAAYVSHLSHVISFALALTVLDKEKTDSHIFDLASGGFSSTARLSKSSASMWTPIFIENKDNLLKVLDTYAEYLERFRKAISGKDEKAIRSLIEEANGIRKIIG